MNFLVNSEPNIDTVVLDSIESIVNVHNIFESEKVVIKEKTFDSIVIKYFDGLVSYKVIDRTSYKIEGLDCIGKHIIRINKITMGLDFTQEDTEYFILTSHTIIDWIINLIDIFNEEDLLNRCTVCAKKASKVKIKIINTCDNPECEKKFYHLVTDNIVLDNFNKDPRVCIFLIQLLIHGSSHPKGNLAFNPLPKIIGVKNIEDFKSIMPEQFKQKNFGYFIDKFTESKDDIKLEKSIGDLSYAIIKNALSSNYFSLTSNESVFPNNSTVLINVNHPTEIEIKFKNNYEFLFHGSSMWSWYPIVKNGLKVLSGTDLQANGAAYGTGIYFSDNFQTSLSYSQRSKISDYNVVGVFQISEPIEKYKKASGIFVIDNDKILMLKSLIICKSSSDYKTSEIINKFYSKDYKIGTQIVNLGVNIVKNKRLNKEIIMLNNHGITNVQIVNETSEWIITSNKYIIKILFTNYPITPPNIILIQEIDCIFPLVFLDSNKNIILPILHPSNWTLNNNLVEIFRQLDQII